jgi:hypothetical protein
MKNRKMNINLESVQSTGAWNLILNCCSQYEAKDEDFNLRIA